MTSGYSAVPGSFRDPSGYVYLRDNEIYRQVNQSYREDYDLLLDSGLYQQLVDDRLLVHHTEVGLEHAAVGDNAYKVIKPQQISFISHPYEWCFSQLKDAALLTLEIQTRAFSAGMSLKDCSAYNVQFVGSNPILIDTLSFEKYREGQPWVAYRQFCQHFLAPLALMSHVDVRLHQLLRIYLDGIPLNLASQLLPRRTRLSFGLLSHIHLHAKAQERFAESSTPSTGKVGQTSFLGLVDSLRSAVTKLSWQAGGTEWHGYYDKTNYSNAAFEHKQQLVGKMLTRIAPSPISVWDLGANEGVFSRIASNMGIPTLSFDIDPAAVEANYLQCQVEGQNDILPLVLDLTNPSPGTGWENQERSSLIERGPADCAMALALIHHLAISNNLPFSKIARFLSRICRALIIEFVPKSDSQVQRLLLSREDIFAEYHQEAFEAEFSQYFALTHREHVRDTERTLYLMEAQR